VFIDDFIFCCSQELLDAVEAEKSVRSRNNHSSSLTNSRVPFGYSNGDHVSELIALLNCFLVLKFVGLVSFLDTFIILSFND
jgi:hypothetical protein